MFSHGLFYHLSNKLLNSGHDTYYVLEGLLINPEEINEIDHHTYNLFVQSLVGFLREGRSTRVAFDLVDYYISLAKIDLISF